jgi:hypothetical protein
MQDGSSRDGLLYNFGPTLLMSLTLAPITHEGQVYDRNMDSGFGDGIHGERDVVLRECLASDNLPPVFDPSSRLFRRGGGDTVICEPSCISEAQNIVKTRETSGAIVNDDVRLVGGSLDGLFVRHQREESGILMLRGMITPRAQI